MPISIKSKWRGGGGGGGSDHDSTYLDQVGSGLDWDGGFELDLHFVLLWDLKLGRWMGETLKLQLGKLWLLAQVSIRQLGTSFRHNVSNWISSCTLLLFAAVTAVAQEAERGKTEQETVSVNSRGKEKEDAGGSFTLLAFKMKLQRVWGRICVLYAIYIYTRRVEKCPSSLNTTNERTAHLTGCATGGD